MRKLIAVIATFIFLMCSCSTTKLIEVPIENIRTEYIHDTRIDSIFMRDSVDRYMKGDTFYIYKEHTKFKYINRVDTICKTDTITKAIKVDVIKEVEVNHIHWYQKILMMIGGLAVLLILFKIKFK